MNKTQIPEKKYIQEMYLKQNDPPFACLVVSWCHTIRMHMAWIKVAFASHEHY